MRSSAEVFEQPRSNQKSPREGTADGSLLAGLAERSADFSVRLPDVVMPRPLVSMMML